MEPLKEVTITAVEKKNIAVLGAGFFGIMAAIKLAERGFIVTIFDKNKDIMLGASYINQNRIHLGYHYPRSEETAKSSFIYQKAFCNLFKDCVVTNFDHYYCVAKKNSLVNGQQYKDFCKKLDLPFIEEFPQNITCSKEEIETCLKVPEHIYDANKLRELLRTQILNEDTIILTLSTEVTAIKNGGKGFEITSTKDGKIQKSKFDAIVNATYSNINKMALMAGFSVKDYQYELCEVPIVKVPWEIRTGCGIMDGPFFGILPFGFSNNYMLYDVEISVIERFVGKLPTFKHSISYYDETPRKEERIKTYLNKAKKYIKEMDKCKYLYSAYITRIVLPNRDKDDARPTEIVFHGQGFWSIFSGKLSAAIPASEKITEEAELFFNNQQ